MIQGQTAILIFIAALFVGAFLGAIIVSLMVAARDAEDNLSKMEEAGLRLSKEGADAEEIPSRH